MAKTTKFIGREFTVNDDLVWEGPHKELVEILNLESERIEYDYTPADGDPRAYSYYTMLNKFDSLKKGVDDEKIVKPEKGVVY